MKILEENVRENHEIIKSAKENGSWKSGLDANRDLFEESNRRFQKKIKELKDRLKEASE